MQPFQWHGNGPFGLIQPWYETTKRCGQPFSNRQRERWRWQPARLSDVSVTLDQPRYEGDTRLRLLERVKTRAVGKSDVDVLGPNGLLCVDLLSFTLGMRWCYRTALGICIRSSFKNEVI